jgi:hypothetical protein
MKNLVITFILTILASPAIAEIKYNKTIDEMTDAETHAMFLSSENMGRYRSDGPAYIAYRCSKGKSELLLKTGEYIGDTPRGFDYRFDKKEQVEVRRSTNLSSSTNNKVTFLTAGLKRKFIGLIEKSSTLSLRNYDYSGVSEAVYKFKLNGTEAIINKVNAAGGCN